MSTEHSVAFYMIDKLEASDVSFSQEICFLWVRGVGGRVKPNRIINNVGDMI